MNWLKTETTVNEINYNAELLSKARKMTKIMYDVLPSRGKQTYISMVNVFGGVLKNEATVCSDFDLLIVWNQKPDGIWNEVLVALKEVGIMPVTNDHRAGRFNTQHIMKDVLLDELDENMGRGGWLQRAAESHLRLWDEVRGASDQS